MKKILKQLCDASLSKLGKRITNLHSPAKPFLEGVFFLKQIIDKPSWIIDIGVANGTPELTTPFPFSEYKYLLVEADPQFTQDLDNIKHRFPDNAVIEQCFCGKDEGTTIAFNVNNDGRSSSGYSSIGRKKTISVKTHKLDTLVSKHKIQGPVLLKVDVEGAEIDVLQGGINSLKICDVVILESWINPDKNIRTPSDFATLVSFMKQQSFVVFDFFGGHSYRSGVLKLIDIVFVREDSIYRDIR